MYVIFWSTCNVVALQPRIVCHFSQLGPWLAVEIPDLIEKGLITHQDKSAASN